MTPSQAAVLAEDMGHAMKKYAKSENAIIDNFKNGIIAKYVNISRDISKWSLKTSNKLVFWIQLCGVKL